MRSSSCRFTSIATFVFAAAAITSACGCALKRSAPLGTTPPPAPAASPSEQPLESAVRAHPAPVGTPENLDKAEAAAAAAPGDAEAQLNAANAYYKIHAYRDAAEAYNKAIKLRPNATAVPFLYKGYAQMAQGDLTQAIATLQRALNVPTARAADKADAYLEIGNCQWALRQDAEAARSFRQSLALNPKAGQASLALGVYEAQNGHKDAARALFTTASRDLPPGSDRAQAFSCLGRLAEESADIHTAAENYHRALALDSRNAWAKKGLERLKAAR